MNRKVLLLGLLLLLPWIALAQDVDVSVERYGADLYEIVGQDLFIQTEYCFVGQERAVVTLELENSKGMMLFKKSGERCEIIRVFGRSSLKAGDYNFQVNRDDENWYGIVGQDGAFKTSGCYSLVENAEAKVAIGDDGTGTLTLLAADEECRIEGVYSKAELEVVEK